jgi:hypothetical protein
MSNAEIKKITVQHTYKMGDNDSRNEARRICFLEAKRSVLEQAGSYIESRTEIRNFQLSKDEVSAYSAALLKVETVNENWGNMSVTMTVSALVDTDYIEKQLAKIKKDTSVQNEMKSQQEKIRELERTVASMQKQLQSADAMEAGPLRKERNIVIKQIDTLEAKKIEIVEMIHKKARNAKQYITTSMTKKDVTALLGDPDGTDVEYVTSIQTTCYIWYYGYTKVYFNSAGMVVMIK